jgi:predicted ATPase/DNA-binding winged helix-turn-helix (wHTH) protein
MSASPLECVRSEVRMHASDSTNEVISFGPFRLYPARRLLEREDISLRLGGRAFDILTVLVEHAGRVVGKNELTARVWPGVTVDESCLRVQVAALRKALGDGEAGTRYVTTLMGQGYCFVAPVFRSIEPGPSTRTAFVAHSAQRLPPRLTRIVGRDETVQDISSQLMEDRFVTIAGPGGVGKTTVAISVGHELLADFTGFVHFFDLGPLDDAQLVTGAVASALGLMVQSSDSEPGIIAFLREKRVLLIFDSCEHVIETVAALAESIFKEASDVHILATSREPLRVEGEHVNRLSPLATPPDDATLTAAQSLGYSAVQLFVERATASDRHFELSDNNAPIVSGICRKLDGMALAIELAAGRVNAYSVQETMALLDDRFRIFWQGRRTALARHQTLSATLDWSYDLLSDLERLVLQRLSIFAGVFTLDAACSVAASQDMPVVAVVASLIEKSLVSINGRDAKHYRLLDMTRAYAAGKLAESGEMEAIKRRHAIYYRDLLERTDPVSMGISDVGGTRAAEHLDNVRAALDWSLLRKGDAEIGIALATASSRVFLDVSFLTECQRWTELALAAIDDTTRGTNYEMKLQAELGLSLMFTKGNSEEARRALEQGLRIAEDLDDLHGQLRLLGRLHLFHGRIGDCYGALAFAQRGEIVAKRLGDCAGTIVAHSLLGVAYHFTGKYSTAREHLEAAVARSPVSRCIDTVDFGFDHRNRAAIALARTLWVQGYPDQAVSVARQTVEEAADHPVTLCVALLWATSVFISVGDLTSAEKSAADLVSHAERHSLTPYHAVGLGFQGELSIKKGQLEIGMKALRHSLESLHSARWELLALEFSGAMADGMARTGEYSQALIMIDRVLALAQRAGDLFQVPDLLRMKGDLLLSSPRREAALAEQCYTKSLELAKCQSALAWELRTATSLARLRARQGRFVEARNALAPAFNRYTEGFDSTDLVEAKKVLVELRDVASEIVGV